MKLEAEDAEKFLIIITARQSMNGVREAVQHAEYLRQQLDYLELEDIEVSVCHKVDVEATRDGA